MKHKHCIISKQDNCSEYFSSVTKAAENAMTQILRYKLAAMLESAYEMMAISYMEGMKYTTRHNIQDPEMLRLLMLLRDAVNIAAPGTLPDNNDPYCESPGCECG